MEQSDLSTDEEVYTDPADRYKYVRLKDSIRLLIGKRKATYPDQALIRFVEFGIWSQYSDDVDLAQAAARQAANILLWSAARKYADSAPKRASAETLVRLLSERKNAKLFDDVVHEDSGWFAPQTKLDLNAVDKRYDDNGVVADLVEFQMRYLEYKPDARPINITRAYRFCLGDPTRTSYRWKTDHVYYKRKIKEDPDLATKREQMSDKTMSGRWIARRDSAAFIYCIEKSSLDIFFPDTGRFVSAGRLRRYTPEPAAMAQFFGTCAYINDKLLEVGSGGIGKECFPSADELPRICPTADLHWKPFSEEELQRIRAAAPK